MKIILTSFFAVSMLSLTAQQRKQEEQNIYGHNKTTFVYTGINVGYINKINSGTIGLEVGIKNGNLATELFMIVPTTTLAISPRMFGINVGYQIDHFKPFLGIVRQTVGAEVEQKFKGTSDEFINQYTSVYGITYYNRLVPLSITIEKLGKYSLASLGCYITF